MGKRITILIRLQPMKIIFDWSSILNDSNGLMLQKLCLTGLNNRLKTSLITIGLKQVLHVTVILSLENTVCLNWALESKTKVFMNILLSRMCTQAVAEASSILSRILSHSLPDSQILRAIGSLNLIISRLWRENDIWRNLILLGRSWRPSWKPILRSSMEWTPGGSQE